MKSYLDSPFLLVGFCVAFLTSSAFAKVDYSGIYAQVPAPATQDTIVYHLDGIAKHRHWILSLEPDSSLTNFGVATGTVEEIDPMTAPESRNESIARLPEASYALSDSTFRLKNFASSDRSVWVISQIPLNRIISVYEGPRLVFHSKVNENTLLVDGNVAPDRSETIGLYGVGLLRAPVAIQELFGEGVSQDSRGVWIAHAGELQRHLKSLPTIQGPFEGQTYPLFEHRFAVIAARIVVDTTGHVSEYRVQREEGSGPLAEAAKQAILHARFEPFLSPEGKPVPVEADVSVSLGKDDENPHVSLALR